MAPTSYYRILESLIIMDSKIYFQFTEHAFKPNCIVTIYEITYLQIENKSHQWSIKNIMKLNNG